MKTVRWETIKNNIGNEVFTSMSHLQGTDAPCYALIESIHNKLAENMSLNGTVTTILPPDGTFTDAAGWYEKIVLPYGDKNLPGYEFRYIVKEKNQNDITPAA